MGQMRYYNKADLIVLISNTTAVARSGSYNNFATVVTWTNVCDQTSVTRPRRRGSWVTNTVQGLIATNITFYDSRAGQYVNCTDVDVSDLPEEDCVLTVKKSAPPGEETHPVSEDIFAEKARTGETANEVVARRKEEGDHRYRWVTGVESRKHFFEVSISLSIDYSFRPMEE